MMPELRSGSGEEFWEEAALLIQLDSRMQAEGIMSSSLDRCYIDVALLAPAWRGFAENALECG